jgi:hypothetical protein
MVRKCKLCEYWENAGIEHSAGECRRVTPGDSGQWPTTQAGDWCGEYRYRISMEQEVPHECKFCEFWEAEIGQTDGECRRTAPCINQDQQLGSHPVTHAGQWCGEFMLREGKLAVGRDKCPV